MGLPSWRLRLGPAGEFSIDGPELMRTGASISRPMTWARVVLPRPGGP